jgi:negative regulator of sigma E activity
VTALDRLEAVRGRVPGARGAARDALVRDLAAADQQLVDAVAAALPDAERRELRATAAAELAPFRARMGPDAFAAAVEAATARLVRERYRLPVLALP